MIDALIPLIAGKIGEKVNEKVRSKISDLDIKDKAKSFFQKKYQESNLYRKQQENKDKQFIKKKDDYEKQLQKELENLKNLKDKGANQSKLIAQLEKLSELEDKISEIEDFKIEKERKVKEVQEKTEQKLLTIELQKQQALLDKLQKGRKSKNKQTKIDAQTKKIEEIQNKINGVNNQNQDDTNFSFEESPKLKSKSSKTPKTEESILGDIETGMENVSVLEDSNIGFGSSLTNTDSEEDSILPNETEIKGVKLTNLLLLNNKKQLEELEDVNKNLDKLTDKVENMEGGGGLLDLLKKPKNIAKTALKYAPKMAKVGGAVLAGAFEVGGAAIDYNTTQKELKTKLENGEITQEEYDQLSKKNKYKNGGRAGGALAGAAAGAAIGSFVPIIGTAIGAGVGALAGGYLGKSGGEEMADYLKTTAYLESGFNPNAKAGTSSASGLYQFTQGTWDDMNKKHGLNYSQEDRFDPQKSAQMAALFAAENKQKIEKGTGQKATGTDMYMGHFLGAGGAVDFLNAKNKRGDDIVANDPKFKAAAAANKSIFYNKDGTPRSYKEIYQVMDNKYKKGEQKADALLEKYGNGIPEVPGKKEELMQTPIVAPQEIKEPAKMTKIDSAVFDYDKKKETEAKTAQAESSKMISSAVAQSIPSPQMSIPQSSKNSSLPMVDDSISSAIRWVINN